MTYLEHWGLKGLIFKGLTCFPCHGLVQFVGFANYGIVLQVVVSVSFLTTQNFFFFVLTSAISDVIQRADRGK